ncbi:hypothetical protein PSAB6_70110 [Paraburkholderia sabiae]|nr:hypothetical protein PSAB6_70110 [Paraburkholderia sabiae]
MSVFSPLTLPRASDRNILYAKEPEKYRPYRRGPGYRRFCNPATERLGPATCFRAPAARPVAAFRRSLRADQT